MEGLWTTDKFYNNSKFPIEGWRDSEWGWSWNRPAAVRGLNSIFFPWRPFKASSLLPTAELWTRVRHFLKPGPNSVHYILTHFHWLWDVINNTFLRDVLMRLVLTGLSSWPHIHRCIITVSNGFFLHLFGLQWGPTWFLARQLTTQSMLTSAGSPTLTWATTRGCCPQCQRTVPLLWGSKVCRFVGLISRCMCH